MSIEVLCETSSDVSRLALAVGLLPFVGLCGWFGVRGPVRVETAGQASVLMFTGVAAAMLWLLVPSLIFAAMLGGTTTTTTTTQPSSDATTLPSHEPTTPTAALTGPQRAWLSATVPLIPLMLMVGVIFSSAQRVRSVGLNPGGVLRGIVVGVGMLVAILPLVWAMSEITITLWEALGWSHPRAHDLLVTYHDKADWLTRGVVLFAAVIAAPLFEEFLFRGCLQTALSSGLQSQWPGSESLARWTGIVVISLIFALVHTWWMQPIIFVLSLAIGWIYERTGNLWAAIVAHAAFNGVSTLLSIYAPAPPTP